VLAITSYFKSWNTALKLLLGHRHGRVSCGGGVEGLKDIEVPILRDRRFAGRACCTQFVFD
jgi:hypothetical protein